MWDARAATAGLRLHRHRDQEQQRHSHTHTHTHMSADDEDIYLRGSVNVLDLDIAVDAPAARPRNPRRLLHHKPQRHTLAGASPAGMYVLLPSPHSISLESQLELVPGGGRGLIGLVSGRMLFCGVCHDGVCRVTRSRAHAGSVWRRAQPPVDARRSREWKTGKWKKGKGQLCIGWFPPIAVGCCGRMMLPSLLQSTSLRYQHCPLPVVLPTLLFA